jgi:ferritin-like metal-binding protein YciE
MFLNLLLCHIVIINTYVETMSSTHTFTEDYNMKIWNYLVALAESFGRARAAATLSRMGKYEEARQLMTANKR